MIDDIDHGLHPKAQIQFIDLLRQVMVGIPEIQIIATSHSPYILDQLQPNEIRVMDIALLAE